MSKKDVSAVVSVVTIDPMSLVPEHALWGSIIILDLNENPKVIWVGSQLYVDVAHVLSHLCKGLELTLEDVHVMPPSQFNSAVWETSKMTGIAPNPPVF